MTPVAWRRRARGVALTARPPADGDKIPDVSSQSDVVVIGAGIVGSAIARELAGRFRGSVVVLDPREPGLGATQASAGMLAPYSEVVEGGPLLDLTIRGLEGFDRFIAGLRAEVDLEVPYERTGLLEVATRPDTMVRFEALVRALAARSVDATLLDRDGVRSSEPALAEDVLGGVLLPTQGHVAPRPLQAALVAAARARGVRFERARAIRVSAAAASSTADFAHNHAVRVDTDSGSWLAGRVVLAAGSWSGHIDIAQASVEPPVRPVRGQLLVLDWPGPPLRRVTWNERCYLVPGDGRLLVGATVEEAGFDERNTLAGLRDLMESVCDLVPAAWGATLHETRVGLRPGTLDALPIIGPSSAVPGLVFATGHYRNGILLAPLTAELVAETVLSGAVDPMLYAVRPERFGRL